MKKLFLIICFLGILKSNSQTTSYKYEIEVINYLSPPTFTKIGNNLVYSGTNSSLGNFLSNYIISDFKQNTPTLKKPENLKIFRLEAKSATLAASLCTNFPTIFSGFIDVTNDVVELASYPNDYGTTSPLPYNGQPIERSDLDYINVQKAWDLTTGIDRYGQRVKIGISDTKINTTNYDFINKVTWVGSGTYQNIPYNPNNIYTSHGTAVAGIAAARGNNGQGSVGVCYDCDIVGTAATTGSAYPNLVTLADSGVKLINMSWGSRLSADNPFNQNNQNIINELVERGVIFVAAATNFSSFQTATDYHCGFNNSDINGPKYQGIQYGYPASYDNVISVSTVGHKYPHNVPLTNQSPSYCCTSPFVGGFPIHSNVQDSFSPAVDGSNPNLPVSAIYNKYQEICNLNTAQQYTSSPNGLMIWTTTNPKVDILSPTYDTFNFVKLAEENVIVYQDGATSGATPRVSGTVGLMLAVNECLVHDDVDAILKLTAKDVENMPLNINFVGQIGAGALNAGDAVEFTNELIQPTGNAVVKNHIFNRFNFKLHKIKNNLTLDNVTFKDDCIVSCIAGNQIKLAPGTNLKPNSTGNIFLRGGNGTGAVDVGCANIISNPESRPTASYDNTAKNLNSKTVLYPNPNNGAFKLYNVQSELFGNETINLDVFDLNGRSLFSQKLNQKEIENYEFNLLNLQSGVYIVKISNADYFEELKFIKN